MPLLGARHPWHYHLTQGAARMSSWSKAWAPPPWSPQGKKPEHRMSLLSVRLTLQIRLRDGAEAVNPRGAVLKNQVVGSSNFSWSTRPQASVLTRAGKRYHPAYVTYQVVYLDYHELNICWVHTVPQSTAFVDCVIYSPTCSLCSLLRRCFSYPLLQIMKLRFREC